jgi:hypothetical protein
MVRRQGRAFLSILQGSIVVEHADKACAARRVSQVGGSQTVPLQRRAGAHALIGSTVQLSPSPRTGWQVLLRLSQ